MRNILSEIYQYEKGTFSPKFDVKPLVSIKRLIKRKRKGSYNEGVKEKLEKNSNKKKTTKRKTIGPSSRDSISSKKSYALSKFSP